MDSTLGWILRRLRHPFGSFPVDRRGFIKMRHQGAPAIIRQLQSMQDAAERADWAMYRHSEATDPDADR